MFNVLRPFFEQNCNLRCLSVSSWGSGFSHSPNGVRLRTEVLSRFNTLTEFEYSGGQLDDSRVELLVQALIGHSAMTKISLAGNGLGGKGAGCIGRNVGGKS